MTPGARVAATIECLDRVLAGEAAERVLTNWARASRFAGSKDRRAVRDHVFDALRRRRSLGWLGGGDSGRALMIGQAREAESDPALLFTGAGHAPSPLSGAELRDPPLLSDAPRAIRLDVQDWMLDAVPGDRPETIFAPLRDRAEVFLRANLLKCDRSAALSALAEDDIAGEGHSLSPTAIRVTRGAGSVARARAYREGLVELQDAASQAAADVVARHVGRARLLDFCAGGGGKALALAAHGVAEIVAHDADPRRMADLPARAERAGARIAIALRPEGTFDAVLVDAPCSGSGAWRRQPDAKWRLTPDGLRELTGLQDRILDEASKFVAAGGILAYMTCSIFAAENEARVAAFELRHRGWRREETRRFLPGDGGDGFFVAVLRRA